jgi:hypothetical protein
MLEEIFNIIDYVATCGNALMFKKMINIVGEFFMNFKYGLKEGKVFSGLKMYANL